MLRDALFIAGFDLKQLFRQRETLLWTFLMPALFFYFIGTVTGGSSFGGSAENPDRLELVLPYEPTPGTDFLVETLVTRLEAQNFTVTVLGPSTPVTLRRRLELPALPEAGGFATWTDALTAGERLEPRFLAIRDGSGGTFEEVRISRALYSLLLDMIVLHREGAALTTASLQEVATRPRALAIEVRSAGARPDPPMGYAQTIPGTMVMFTMLILLTGGSILLVSERRSGLLRRLASAPVSRTSALFGKWLGRMGLALVQLVFSMILGRLLFDMDWGDALGAVGLLLLLWAAFNASLSLWLANLVRTEGQMTGIAVLGSMVLAALGGCWWPIEVTPSWMQALAGFLPTGWAMGAMHQLVHFGHGLSSVVQPLLLLLGASLALGALAARHFRYE
jgi:ABC-type multidrug transport system permease subunit